MFQGRKFSVELKTSFGVLGRCCAPDLPILLIFVSHSLDSNGPIERQLCANVTSAVWHPFSTKVLIQGRAWSMLHNGEREHSGSQLPALILWLHSSWEVHYQGGLPWRGSFTAFTWDSGEAMELRGWWDTYTYVMLVSILVMVLIAE